MSQHNETAFAISKMKEHGFQSWVARKTNVSRTTICEILAGKRQCTAKQAATFEDLFILKGIPLNRWDLLYGYEAGTPNSPKLVDYLASKEIAKKQ